MLSSLSLMETVGGVVCAVGGVKQVFGTLIGDSP